MHSAGSLGNPRPSMESAPTACGRSNGASDFCPHGCYWPDCEHRSNRDATPPPPAGTRWVIREGLAVAEREPTADSLDVPVDEFFGELLMMTGRPWSTR